jgi:hypothetical protein
VKQSLLRRTSRRHPSVLDLTKYDAKLDVAEPGPLSDRVRDFYREHSEEIVARMRHPTTQTNNVAAGIVAQCETNPRLRAEAEQAVAAARLAREARRALDYAISAYEPRTRR